jgi:biotin-(acetyl-CoA carboxylase) ligase
MESIDEEQKPWKEQLNSFLKEPTRRNLRNLLQLEAIEDNDLEFKKELLTFDSLAKHILAMGNKNGGVIVFGVEETDSNQFNPCGLPTSFDVTDIEKKIRIYIPKKLELTIIPHYFKGENDPELEGKLFLVLIIGFNLKYAPFIPLKSGENLRKDTIYIRRNRASEPVNYDELQEILNARIETEYSTTDERKLIEHLEELKELYSHIPKTINKVVSRTSPAISEIQKALAMQRDIFGRTEYEAVPNPSYPQESYEEFVGRLIDIKKSIIVNLIKKA